MTLHSKYNYIIHTHTLHYTRLHCTILDYLSLHYTTLHCTTLHYTTLQPQLQLQLRWLHHTTATSPLHYNYSYNCTTPHYIQQLWVRWPLQPLQPLQKAQLQPPFGPSVDSLCHPWFTTTHLSYIFLKLPPPPCAVLLVIVIILNLSLGTLASAIPERQYLDTGRDKLRCCSYILRCRRQVCI